MSMPAIVAGPSDPEETPPPPSKAQEGGRRGPRRSEPSLPTMRAPVGRTPRARGDRAIASCAARPGVCYDRTLIVVADAAVRGGRVAYVGLDQSPIPSNNAV